MRVRKKIRFLMGGGGYFFPAVDGNDYRRKCTGG